MGRSYFYPAARPLPAPRPVDWVAPVPDVTEEDWSQMRPLSSWLLVELTAPPEKTDKGIYVIERAASLWTWCDGRVLGSGPGRSWRDQEGSELSYQLLWAHQGDTVIFQGHDYRPLSQDKRIGLVRDENLVGSYSAAEDIVVPLNGWCRVRQDPSPAREGQVILAEEWAPRPMAGTVEETGFGKLRLTGAQYGRREPISKSLIGAHVHWGEKCEALAVGRERLEYLMIASDDLELTDGEETGSGPDAASLGSGCCGAAA